jgi:hypothetical protein
MVFFGNMNIGENRTIWGNFKQNTQSFDTTKRIRKMGGHKMGGRLQGKFWMGCHPFTRIATKPQYQLGVFQSKGKPANEQNFSTVQIRTQALILPVKIKIHLQKRNNKKGSKSGKSFRFTNCSSQT